MAEPPGRRQRLQRLRLQLWALAGGGGPCLVRRGCRDGEGEPPGGPGVPGDGANHKPEKKILDSKKKNCSPSAGHPDRGRREFKERGGRTPPAPRSMWKLGKGKVLLEDSPEEEEGRGQRRAPPPPAAAAAAAAQNKDQLLQDEITSSVSQLATKVQGASFRGWKEVTSMFNKDDEQQLLEKCKSPKFKGTNLRIKEDVKTEKKSGFWDSLVLKQNIQSKKPDEIEGWEPPQITLENPATDLGDSSKDHLSWPGWEDETKGSTKYTNLTSSGNSSRWSIKSAGKLVSIRRQSKGNLTDNWEELE